MMIVSQPSTVIALEPLSPQEGIEEVAADEHGHDEAEEIGRAQLSDEGGDWG